MVVAIVDVIVIVMKIVLMNNIDIYICINSESSNTLM